MELREIVYFDLAIEFPRLHALNSLMFTECARLMRKKHTVTERRASFYVGPKRNLDKFFNSRPNGSTHFALVVLHGETGLRKRSVQESISSHRWKQSSLALVCITTKQLRKNSIRGRHQTGQDFYFHTRASIFRITGRIPSKFQSQIYCEEWMLPLCAREVRPEARASASCVCGSFMPRKPL